jgi:hypothetical protein
MVSTASGSRLSTLRKFKNQVFEGKYGGAH